MKITHFIVCILITLLIGSTRITAQEATKPDTVGAGPGALPGCDCRNECPLG